MKNQIVFMLGVLFLAACREEKSHSSTTASVSDSGTVTQLAAKDPAPVSASQSQVDTMISLAVLDKKSNDPYVRYGLEFAGNCYDCDLAEIKVNAGTITLYNACDSTINTVIPLTKQIVREKEMRFETANTHFIFTSVDDAPVYRLKIEGTWKPDAHLRIGQYFTFKKMISKFKVHDCGDFGG